MVSTLCTMLRGKCAFNRGFWILGGGGGKGGSTRFSTYSTNPHLLLLKIA